MATQTILQAKFKNVEGEITFDNTEAGHLAQRIVDEIHTTWIACRREERQIKEDNGFDTTALFSSLQETPFDNYAKDKFASLGYADEQTPKYKLVYGDTKEYMDFITTDGAATKFGIVTIIKK